MLRFSALLLLVTACEGYDGATTQPDHTESPVVQEHATRLAQPVQEEEPAQQLQADAGAGAGDAMAPTDACVPRVIYVGTLTRSSCDPLYRKMAEGNDAEFFP